MLPGISDGNRVKKEETGVVPCGAVHKEKSTRIYSIFRVVITFNPVSEFDFAAGAATSPSRASAVPSAISTMSGYGGANDAESDQVRCSGQAPYCIARGQREGVAAADVASRLGRVTYAGQPAVCLFLAPGGLVRRVVVSWRSASNHCWTLGLFIILMIKFRLQAGDAFHSIIL